MKFCPKCEMRKSLEDFHRNATRSDGRQAHCKECVLQAAQVYYIKNKTRLDARIAIYEESHREQKNATGRSRHNANLERERARNRAHRAANPEQSAARSAKRRSLIRGCAEHFTSAELLALYEFYDFRCLACGVQKGELDINGEILCLTPDHIIPISKGGADTIDNIQPLCMPCNNKKLVKSTDYRPNWDEKSA